MPPFTITTCIATDGPALAENNNSAFWTNPTWRLLWTRVDKTLPYIISQASLRWSHNILKNPELSRHQKAVDEVTGELVGYCKWVFPEGLEGAEGMWEEAKVPRVSEAEAERLKVQSEGADWVFDHALDVLDAPELAMKERMMAEKKYLLLDYMAVHPKHWKQGIALQLVQSGLREAEKLGLDVFVMAFSQGRRVYERAGFTWRGEVVQDVSQFGGTKHGVYFMEKRIESKEGLEKQAIRLKEEKRKEEEKIIKDEEKRKAQEKSGGADRVEEEKKEDEVVTCLEEVNLAQT